MVCSPLPRTGEGQGERVSASVCEGGNLVRQTLSPDPSPTCGRGETQKAI